MIETPLALVYHSVDTEVIAATTKGPSGQSGSPERRPDVVVLWAAD
jgi:hypothetical protein